MESRISHSFLRILAVLALLSGSIIVAAAQRETDPNYNSPTPILLSETNSTRALAQTSRDAARINPSKIPARAFSLNSQIVLYVSDLQLMSGEGANAFRIYAEDGRGHSYRYPVLDIQPSQFYKNVWEVTTRLTDEIGYWAPPKNRGDLLIYLTWRGLASNKVRLGLGRVGGDIKQGGDEKPTPIGTTAMSTSGRAPTSSVSTSVLKKFTDHARFLEQATFGPTRDFETQFSVPTRFPITAWINNQFNLAYPSASNPYPDVNYPLKPGTPPADCDGDQVNTVADNPPTCYRDTYTLYPIQTWNSKEILYGEAQLHHKVTWALSQIWVNSGVDIQQSRHMVEWHKIISNNAFGNYRNLMGQMTLSPTMGDYLSMSQSTKNNPNENYAREIMQLFTIGLFMLNQDGTVICVENNPCQPGNTPIPTYDQTNVNSLTKVLTGWTYCQNALLPACSHAVSGSLNFIDPMIMTSSANHDTTAKTLLTYNGTTATIAACTNCTGGTTAVNLANTQAYAASSMNQALDNIFYHPNLGPYVSKLLIQQMVTSDPSPAYVGRVAAAFNDNGLSVRGDMKAVITAILTDVEARGSNKTDPNYGKLREPVQFAANILRAFNVRSQDTFSQSDGVFITSSGTYSGSTYTGMGQNPFRSPTVFNYYPPDFVIPGTSLLGPEFALMTTGTAIQRANFVNRMVFTSPAIPVSAASRTGGTPNGTSLDFADLEGMLALDNTGDTVLTELNRRMMHGTMSATMRSTILTAIAGVPISTPPTQAEILARVRQAIYLIATSSQYQVQR